MALYLIPTNKNVYIERRSKSLAKLGFATEDVLAMPEPHKASDLGKPERFTSWKALKALKVESIKGVM